MSAIEMLTPNTLRVDPNSQRSFSPAWAKHLADNYDPDKVGVLRVSRRPDGDYVWDGQHRRAMLIRLGKGDEPVTCLVDSDKEKAAEAKAWVATNQETRKTNPLDGFRIRLVAQDPLALEINEIVQEKGFRVDPAASDGNIAAVAALEFAHRRGLLESVLDVLAHAWGQNRDAFDALPIRGVALVLEQHPAIDQERLSRRLARGTDPVSLSQDAKFMARSNRTSQPEAMKALMIREYNRQLHAGSRLAV